MASPETRPAEPLTSKEAGEFRATLIITLLALATGAAIGLSTSSFALGFVGIFLALIVIGSTYWLAAKLFGWPQPAWRIFDLFLLWP